MAVALKVFGTPQIPLRGRQQLRVDTAEGFSSTFHQVRLGSVWVGSSQVAIERT